MSLFKELKRRNVIRVGIAYLAVSWLLIQIAETLLPVYGYADVAIRNLVAILVVGLVPVLILAWVFEWTPEGLKKDSDVDPSASRDDRSNKLLDRLVVAVLVLAVGYFAVDKFMLDPARDAREIEAATKKGRSDATIKSFGDKSIAVLAFDDMSPAGDQEYFSDGIAEEVLNLLAKINELRVISRSTAFTFKGSNETLSEIAEKLDVTYILEGSVRKAGDKIRITAQLIDARTDAHVWSQTYDRTLDDVFAIQDEISAHVVDELKLTLLGGIPKATEVDPRAYDLYLQAKHNISNWDGGNLDDVNMLEQAEALLNQALEIEPNFVALLFELGRVYGRMGSDAGLITREEVRARRQTITDRVIAIDPNSAAAFFWQGLMAWEYEEDLHSAAAYFEQSMRADPAAIDHMRRIAYFLVHIGRVDEAIAMGNYNVRRDPACMMCVYSLSWSYRDSGRHQEAAETLEGILKWRSPDASFFWLLGTMWLHAGHPDKALDAFQKELDEGTRDYAIIFALHDLGRMEEFESRLAERIKEAERGEEGREGVARIYAWMGENDKAFEWLDHMVEAEGSEMIDMIHTDYYEKIKSDPRWRALREKYGYFDVPIEGIEIEVTLPPGVTID
jgi:TolB-like protein